MHYSFHKISKNEKNTVSIFVWEILKSCAELRFFSSLHTFHDSESDSSSYFVNFGILIM